MMPPSHATIGNYNTINNNNNNNKCSANKPSASTNVKYYGIQPNKYTNYYQNNLKQQSHLKLIEIPSLFNNT